MRLLRRRGFQRTAVGRRATDELERLAIAQMVWIDHVIAAHGGVPDGPGHVHVPGGQGPREARHDRAAGAVEELHWPVDQIAQRADGIAKVDCLLVDQQFLEGEGHQVTPWKVESRE